MTKEFKITDFCLGNKVIYNETIYEIVGINSNNCVSIVKYDKSCAMTPVILQNIHFSEIKPIPITEEILKKNDWYLAVTETYFGSKGTLSRTFKHECGFFIKIHYSDNENLNIIGTTKSECYFREVHYVHEIENIISHCSQLELHLLV